MLNRTPAAADGRHWDDPRAFYRTSTSTSPLQITGDAPPWVAPVTRRLATLLELGTNWRGSPSARIEPRLAENAVNAVLALVMPTAEGPVPQVVPLVDGGLQLEWHQGGWDIEVSLSPLGEVWIDAASADGLIEWADHFAARREDLALLLQSIA